MLLPNIYDPNSSLLIDTAPKILRLRLSYNPNVPLTERPVIAITVACLTNRICDIDIVSDHTCRQCILNVCSMHIVGDVAIARYIARQFRSATSGSNSNIHESIIDQWVDYSLIMSRTSCLNLRIQAIRSTLDSVLEHRTYILGHVMSFVDIAIFKALGFPAQIHDLENISNFLDGNSPTSRWMHMMRSHPSIQTATQLAVGITHTDEAVFDKHIKMKPLVKGMIPLVGATPGNVVTRFPPEPSGYLHIGHVKAVLMNEYYARRYKGTFILRFDDTNPSNEKEEFTSSILEDLQLLSIEPNIVTFTSDYFYAIKFYVKFMIDNGFAYMDDTPQDKMQTERRAKVNSKHRDQSITDCHTYFELMCSGNLDGTKWCLRAKIDMQSANGALRDPVIYRPNSTPHVRTKKTFSAYPTYDLACPIVDSIEGVTHALRTTEYNDRDEQYCWFQNILQIRKVRIHSFARMNFNYTLLSKRKLAWFVHEKHVIGWDDPRFPTIRGVIRHGVNTIALKNFIYSQGVSRRIVTMEWVKFWAENKKQIDPVAKRYMAIDRLRNVTLLLTNGPREDERSYISTDFLPKKTVMGKRVVRICRNILIEQDDIEGIVVGEFVILMRWGVVQITKSLDGVYEGVFSSDASLKGIKRKLTWIANVNDIVPLFIHEYGSLLLKEKIEENENFQDYRNPNSFKTTQLLGDAGLKKLQKDDIIQLERRGYYRVDRQYIKGNRSIVLLKIPDGKRKKT